MNFILWRKTKFHLLDNIKYLLDSILFIFVEIIVMIFCVLENNDKVHDGRYLVARIAA